VSSFWLSRKKAKETWVEPKIDHTVVPPSINFEVKVKNNENGP
jgi:hypothetical protein